MITRIHHVAIVVRSLEGALGVYRDILGLPVGTRATVADQGVHAALLPMDEGEIELLEPSDATGGVARFLERRGEGLHHLCFETPDVSAALAQAKAAALPLIDQMPRPGLAGMIAFLHPKANRGVLVELAQPLTPPQHPKSPSTGVEAVEIATVYLAVKELSAAATSLVQNFGGRAGAGQDESRFSAHAIAVSIGTSQVTLLHSPDPASPIARFLADRGEGLYGVCLRVSDFKGALGHLEAAGFSVRTRGADTSEPVALLEPERVHGVNLFLCPPAPAAPPRAPAG